MSEASKGIIKIHNDFEELREFLRDFLRRGELLEKNILVKSGFILRKYSLKVNKVNMDSLNNLIDILKKVIAIENDINYNLDQILEDLKEIERAYNAYLKEKLHISKIFTQDMNNCFYLSRLMSNQAFALINEIKKGAKVQDKAGVPRVRTLLNSLEKTGNQILKFIDLLEQMIKKIATFETVSFFDNERLYGRAMSKEEYSATRSKKELVGSPKRAEGDLIGVFECTSSKQVERINSMSEDERKNFFGSIGVVGAVKIVFFKTKLKPVTGPNPQSNGLIERKFPKGTPIIIAA